MIISTTEAPAAIGPYSQAIVHNGMVYCSGQISLTPEGEGPKGETAAEQTELIFNNIEAVLKAAGSSLDRIVKTTIFLIDMDDFTAVNEVYGKRLGEHRPARSTVAVTSLPKAAIVEIEILASTVDLS